MSDGRIEGIHYLREAIILRAKEDYMRAKAGGRAERAIEFDIRGEWWNEIILEDIDPEAVIEAWRTEKAEIPEGKLWRAPKEYHKTFD